MKSTFLFSALLLAAVLPANAQLADTKWQGTIQIPGQNGEKQAVQTVWQFSSDTIRVVYIAARFPPEVMAYAESDGIVTLHKVSGGIPCDGEAIGKYRYEIKAGKLYLFKVEDACEIRGNVDVSQPFDKVLL